MMGWFIYRYSTIFFSIIIKIFTSYSEINISEIAYSKEKIEKTNSISYICYLKLKLIVLAKSI